MNEETQANLENALHLYRETVLKHNLAALDVVVSGVDEDADPSDLSEDEIRKLRLELLRSEYGLWVEDPAHQPHRIQDLLLGDVKASLIATCSLDGIDHGDADAEKSNSWLEDLFDRASRVYTSATPLEAFPATLRYLTTLVRGVCGPGLPKYRETSQTTFITDITRLSDYDDDRVVTPLSQAQMNGGEFNALSPAWSEWEIAVGVRLGDGPQAWAGGYLLFCRDSRSAQARSWKWRFGLRDEAFESDLYDSIDAFLHWYADFNKQSEEDDNIEIIPLDDIL